MESKRQTKMTGEYKETFSYHDIENLVGGCEETGKTNIFITVKTR